ncbi:MAG: hypothetical protein E5X05_01195 [Mesorhizobium sp.]|nr:MAG: hypothetical protein E5X05_01195 [Mesorhizobium sp.]
MNGLSWLIYAAGVAGNMQGLLIAFSIVSGLGVLFWTIVGAVEREDPWPGLKMAWVPLLSALIAAALPSTSTIYMIAASEAGEKIVTSPDAVEMMGDLKAIIKKRLKEELGGDQH